MDEIMCTHSLHAACDRGAFAVPRRAATLDSINPGAVHMLVSGTAVHVYDTPDRSPAPRAGAAWGTLVAVLAAVIVAVVAAFVVLGVLVQKA
jgi:hypothetical protein